MKVLITGGAGFIGANLALEIQRRFSSAKVAIIDDFSSDSVENLKEFKGELVKGGIEDESFISSLVGKNFDFIHHQAAVTDTTIDDSAKMMKVNVEGFKNILHLAKNEKAHVIYASSAGVYGNGPIPMRESQELAPLNAYALSKVRADEMAFYYAKEHKMRVVGLRYFNVYGKGESHKGKAASMIWQLACQMKEYRNPRIFKYGEQERDFVYIKDVVEATIKAMDAKENSIVNVGTGQKTSFNQIIEILNEVLGTSLETKYFDNPYNFYQNYTQADTSLAEQLLEFKARFGVEKGIRDYLAK